MRAEAEMEQSWGSPVAMRSRDYDDRWEDNGGEDEWDSDADYDLPEGIFCSKFRPGVLTAFSIMYPGLGVRVTL
jgi:hypothetical protein